MEEIKKQETNPLVSVIVCVYNSSKYVIETLESAKAQSYMNIELIITDDGSKDNTVGICSEWLNKNTGRFVSAKFITTEKNAGIATNCNRGLNKAKGKWVKFIAGDDILMDSCIERNLYYTKNSPHAFFFSKMTFTKKNDNLAEYFNKGFQLLTTKTNQLRVLLESNYLTAPTAFIKREALIHLGGFDERFPLLDDYPLWIKACQNNYFLECIDEPTVIYRIHSEGISQQEVTEKEFYASQAFRQSWFCFMRKIMIREKLKNYMFLDAWGTGIQIIQFNILINIFNNKRNRVSNMVCAMFQLFKPSFYKELIKGFKFNL